MRQAYRNQVHEVNDDPLAFDMSCTSNVQKYLAQAKAIPIPEYRCKKVTLPNGHIEVSVTPANKEHIVNLRMGFNPLLDCLPKEYSEDERKIKDIENKKRAAKHTRQNLRYYSLSIEADRMLTFNYRNPVFDRNVLIIQWKMFLKYFRLDRPHTRDSYKDFQYIAVAEKHDSEKSSDDHRGSYHIHVAVRGHIDIKWARYCWLRAIGQSRKECDDWLYNGVELGEKSLGAVNIQAPVKRWSTGGKWSIRKIAAYMTKYIGKDFDDTPKGVRRFWKSDCAKPKIEKFWLHAKTFDQAIKECRDMLIYFGADDYSYWIDEKWGVLWFTGSTDIKHRGQCKTEIISLDMD